MERALLKKLKIIIDVPKKIIISTDQDRILQIILNLLTNAIKFTFNGTIKIFAEQHKDSCFVSISDTGIGMNRQTRENLERLLNGEFGHKVHKQSSGIGLGLMISNALIKAIAKTPKKGINFISTENRGSSFSFVIPHILSEPESSDIFINIEEDLSLNISSTHRKSSKGGRLHHKLSNKLLFPPTAVRKALIVDDEPYNIFALEKALKSFDLQVDKAFNGKDAIEKIKGDSNIKLVFMDVNMPVMNGIDATVALKSIIKSREIQDLLIIGVTAYVNTKDIQNCYSAGMDHVLNKPVQKSTLREVLEKYDIGNIPNE